MKIIAVPPACKFRTQMFSVAPTGPGGGGGDGGGDGGGECTAPPTHPITVPERMLLLLPSQQGSCGYPFGCCVARFKSWWQRSWLFSNPAMLLQILYPCCIGINLWYWHQQQL
jgi:hypothetical protein